MDLAAAPKFPVNVSCPHAAACPGCPLIAHPYTEQLEKKHEVVASALHCYPELTSLQVTASVGAEQVVGYRTRAKLVSQGSAVGLFARGTHQVVDTPDCQVLDPLVKELVSALRLALKPSVALDGVDVTRVGERLLVTLIAQPATDERELRTLADVLAQRVPAVAGVAYSRRERDAVQLLSGGHLLLHGLAELRSSVTPGQPYHYVALGAFQQAHAETSAAIYARLAEHLFASVQGSARPRVLELYAGSGALSLALAARGAEVTAVESYAPACERLARAAREQRLPVQVREGDAARELRALWEANQRFDAVLVNPPRRGLDPEVREVIAQLAPKGLGYVSCKASTLARDLAHFARLGLRCVEAVPFDMMPLTEQVETCCWLQPASAALPEIVHEEGPLLAVAKAAHELVDARGERGLSARVRGLPGFQAALPVTTLASGSSGLVLFTRDAGQRERVEQRLGEEPTFTALVRGVVRERGKVRVSSRTARYERLQVIAGHSLVRMQATDDTQVLRAFRAIGHPVIGDRAADRASAKHFMMRHGLDRTFLHASSLVLVGGGERRELAAPLAADLCAVLASMASSS